jgi:hypothetical protein
VSPVAQHCSADVTGRTRLLPHHYTSKVGQWGMVGLPREKNSKRGEDLTPLPPTAPHASLSPPRREACACPIAPTVQCGCSAISRSAYLGEFACVTPGLDCYTTWGFSLFDRARSVFHVFALAVLIHIDMQRTSPVNLCRHCWADRDLPSHAVATSAAADASVTQGSLSASESQFSPQPSPHPSTFTPALEFNSISILPFTAH